MKRLKWRIFAYVVFFAVNVAVAAETQLPIPTNEIPDLPQPIVIPSLSATQADWAFSGMVANENGERYSYYFQIQRNETQFHAIATLIDSQNKEVLLFEQSDVNIIQQDANNWQVGRAFLQFNPINNSWIFGVKTAAKKGFNFKVDMLSQSGQAGNTLNLRPGIKLLVSQSGRLNGHLQTGENSKEQFITAPKAWFRQVWASDEQDTLHLFTGVLCEFNDGSGFYSVNLQETDALRGAVAGWRNSQGLPVPMSQFVTVEEAKNNTWYITIPSPKMRLLFQNVLIEDNDRHQLMAGLTEGEMAGFCTINKDSIGRPPVMEKIVG